MQHDKDQYILSTQQVKALFILLPPVFNIQYPLEIKIDDITIASFTLYNNGTGTLERQQNGSDEHFNRLLSDIEIYVNEASSTPDSVCLKDNELDALQQILRDGKDYQGKQNIPPAALSIWKGSAYIGRLHRGTLSFDSTEANGPQLFKQLLSDIETEVNANQGVATEGWTTRTTAKPNSGQQRT
jgi:hypothetical protein